MGKGACCRKSTVEVGGLTQRNALILRGLPCLEAKTQLLQNVSSLKRNQEAAGLLARLLPEGGRAMRMWRSVAHLSEVLPWLHEVHFFSPAWRIILCGNWLITLVCKSWIRNLSHNMGYITFYSHSLVFCGIILVGNFKKT